MGAITGWTIRPSLRGGGTEAGYQGCARRASRPLATVARPTGAKRGFSRLIVVLNYTGWMDSEPVTIMLNEGKTAAERVEALLPLVYAQLRAAAQGAMKSERAGHTLSATALVHEAYLKLVGPREVPWASRGHFYAAAAEAMRRVLLDHAKAKTAGKRGGPEARRAALDMAGLPDSGSETESAGFLLLEEAISRLEGAAPDAAAVVRLRFFGGLEISEAALALGVSEATVKRNWAFARAWLKDAIERGDAGD